MHFRLIGLACLVTALVIPLLACTEDHTTGSRPATAAASAPAPATRAAQTATVAAAQATATAAVSTTSSAPPSSPAASSSVELGGHLLPGGPVQFSSGSLKYSPDAPAMEVTIANSDRIGHVFNAQADIMDGSGDLISNGTLPVTLASGERQVVDIPLKSFAVPPDGKIQVNFRASGR